MYLLYALLIPISAISWIGVVCMREKKLEFPFPWWGLETPNISFKKVVPAVNAKCTNRLKRTKSTNVIWFIELLTTITCIFSCHTAHGWNALVRISSNCRLNTWTAKHWISVRLESWNVTNSEEFHVFWIGNIESVSELSQCDGFHIALSARKTEFFKGEAACIVIVYKLLVFLLIDWNLFSQIAEFRFFCLGSWPLVCQVILALSCQAISWTVGYHLITPICLLLWS